MPGVFESDGAPLKPGDHDAMEDWLEELDEPTSTTWDLAVENPPHAGYTGYLPHPELPPGGKKPPSQD